MIHRLVRFIAGNRSIVVEPKIDIAIVLPDGGSVRDRHNNMIAQADRQTAKFNSPPNFLADRLKCAQLCIKL